MIPLPHPWDDVTELDERALLAREAADQAAVFSQTEGWAVMCEALIEQVRLTKNDLARSNYRDEQNRGIILALEHVLRMPEELIRSASEVIDKHRWEL